jgi:hypothetical protein
MSHTSEKRWESFRQADGSIEQGINDTVGNMSEKILKAILEGEELFQQLQEMWAFAGGTDQDVADQLFKNKWSVRDTDGDGNMDTAANAEEVAMAIDAKNACLAMHQLYEALTNGTITADDRASKLRRMT